jgi:hypothetical protein
MVFLAKRCMGTCETGTARRCGMDHPPLLRFSALRNPCLPKFRGPNRKRQGCSTLHLPDDFTHPKAMMMGRNGQGCVPSAAPGPDGRRYRLRIDRPKLRTVCGFTLWTSSGNCGSHLDLALGIIRADEAKFPPS